jgi:predicted ribosome quality control (RQC) complex YloA/Tae2 family protein
MNDQTIKAIVEEVAPLLVGQRLGKIFQLSRTSVAIDFRLSDGRYLFISVDPGLAPRLYLVARRVRELEKQSAQPASFLLSLKKHLGGARLLSLTKDEGDRVVRFHFSAEDALGNLKNLVLVAQLTGRAANLLLLDEHGHIIDTLRQLGGAGQEVGGLYSKPQQGGARPSKVVLERGPLASLSEAADDYYSGLERERAFAARAQRERTRLNKEIASRRKLVSRLLEDLTGHGDAEEHKRVGDLLLANLSTAERRGNKAFIRDYYAEDAPVVEVEVDENSSLQEEAARRFTLYTKARRASREISVRLEALEKELKELEAQGEELESIVRAQDADGLHQFGPEAQREQGDGKSRKKRQQAEHVPGARRYVSSDGYEILVGRTSRDNDNLTFRIAKPSDLWLHAADYPGSHVIVRNPTRAEIPHRTVIEAAQYAAGFSQARNDTKVEVNYTQRKFLSKPKGAAPGLVRLSTFRTITVEPQARKA